MGLDGARDRHATPDWRGPAAHAVGIGAHLYCVPRAASWEHLYSEKKQPEPNDPIVTELNAFTLDRVRLRWDLISDFVHAAAYSVDPRFRTDPLDIVHLDDAEMYFKGLCMARLIN